MRKSYTEQDHNTWKIMVDKQLSLIKNSGKVSKHFLRGLKLLPLPDTVPDAQTISKKLEELVGWKIVSASNEYLSGEDRFASLAQKEFPCTEYIRRPHEIDFTPLPDLFHEYFGHMPLMANQRMADLEEHTAKLFLDNPHKHADIFTLSWYSVEYGLIREDGEIKVLGAGILSSPGDLQRFLRGETKILPASTETILQYNPSPHKPHDTLFVFESIQHMQDVLDI